jgi:hypothetical protein
VGDQEVADVAINRAWSVYLLLGNSVDEREERRAALEHFIRALVTNGELDSEVLAVEGLKYLKELDGLDHAPFKHP